MINNYYPDYDDYEENSFEYTKEDLEDMYRDAFDGQPDAYWNID